MSAERPAGADPIYALLLELEDLEALREELDDLDLADVGAAGASQDPAAREIAAQLASRSLTSRAALDERIADLHQQIDRLDGGR